MLRFFAWFEHDYARYAAVSQTAIFALFALVALAAFSRRIASRLETPRGTLVLSGVAAFALFASRWPTFFVLHPLNVDEAQMASQAITALHDPIPWRGFDSGSSGPLNTYVLTLPALLGIHPSFMSARLIAVGLEFGAIVALYAIVARCFEARFARLAIVPPIVFLATTVSEDFAHYSSEVLSIFLSSVALALIVRGWRTHFSRRSAFFAGALAGALPFAKLQSAPLMVVVLAMAVLATLVARSISMRERLAHAAVVAVGSATVPAILIAMMLAGGSLGDFWRSYIETSIAYIGKQDRLFEFLTQTEEFGAYFATLGTITICGTIVLLSKLARYDATKRHALLAFLALLATAIYTIYKPGHSSPHYLLFAVVPLAATAAASVAVVAWLNGADSRPGMRHGAIAALYLALTFVVLGVGTRPTVPWIGLDFERYAAGKPYDPIAETIVRYVAPGERLAIWGWTPEYWVYASALLGTRDSASIFQFAPNFNPERVYFRKRYIADFTTNRPEGFLDAGAESFDFDGGERATVRSFPELAKLVDRDYVRVVRWKRFVFYVRRDLVRRARGAGRERPTRRSCGELTPVT